MKVRGFGEEEWQTENFEKRPTKAAREYAERLLGDSQDANELNGVVEVWDGSSLWRFEVSIKKKTLFESEVVPLP